MLLAEMSPHVNLQMITTSEALNTQDALENLKNYDIFPLGTDFVVSQCLQLLVTNTLAYFEIRTLRSRIVQASDFYDSKKRFHGQGGYHRWIC
jgi:hypothetical protein